MIYGGFQHWLGSRSGELEVSGTRRRIAATIRTAKYQLHISKRVRRKRGLAEDRFGGGRSRGNSGLSRDNLQDRAEEQNRQFPSNSEKSELRLCVVRGSAYCGSLAVERLSDAR